MCGSLKTRIFHHAVKSSAFYLLRAMPADTKILSSFWTVPNIVFFPMTNKLASYLRSLFQEL